MRFVLTLLCCCVLGLTLNCVAQQQFYGSVSMGYNYLSAEGPTGSHTSFNGWYVTPEYNLTKAVGVFANFSNLYGGVGENIHSYTFGPLLSLHNSTRVTPVAFTEFGDVRDSKPAAIANAFAFVVGGGAEIKLNSRVNLQIYPAEYVLTTPEAPGTTTSPSSVCRSRSGRKRRSNHESRFLFLITCECPVCSPDT